ncbi:MAG: single-stranded-DNA-specific exonuclease RecJ [Rickettsiales bacterium]|jgi:single-stranded-DNA-specific exonuclease|nr:single-stranded-DNA-specific exonuclease RecJ [Rickettsiales bacterium]
MTYFSPNKSVKNYRWKINSYDDKKAIAIKQKFGFTEVLSKLLVMKNIPTDDIEAYLEPKMRNVFTSKTMQGILNLKDMQKGVDIIYDTILNNEIIGIFGDYDVDGITSTSLLKNYFDLLKIRTEPYIPDRLKEGYGPNIEAFKTIKSKGANTIITVDCGINAFDVCDEAKKLGMKIVITDHHISAEKMPNADAVINPNRIDENNEFKIIAGVGVAFLFIYSLQKKMRDNDYFAKNKIVEPKLLHFLDLVALGTICDVMPLTGINRAFVSQGLKIIKEKVNIGIVALIENIDIVEEIDVYHLGFMIGPRLNATGRVGESRLSSRILTTKNKNEAKKLAKELDVHNKSRQEIEAKMLVEAFEIIEREKLNEKSIIFLENENWHEGIIGILASRLKDKFEKPVFIATKLETHYKTSCRSIKGIDVGSVIMEMNKKNLLMGGGGHAMAGGFNFDLSKLNEIRDFVNEKLSQKTDDCIIAKEKNIDLQLECKSITIALAKEINKLSPFGVGNYKPKIILKDVYVIKMMFFGKNNDCLKILIGDKNGVKIENTLQAICFRTTKDDLIYQVLLKNKKVNLLGEININKYQGREILQFIVEDVMI